MKWTAVIFAILPLITWSQVDPDSAMVFQNDSLAVDSLAPGGLPGRVLTLAQTYLGTPYKYGSDSGGRFDCSGFVRHCYGSCRIDLPHGSGNQSQLCDPISLADVQPGDLLFFKGRNVKSNLIGHVAMVLDVVDGKVRMIHATTHAGVKIDVYNDSAYYTTRFVKAGRLKRQIIDCLSGQGG